jgi:hypothetical protein
MKSNSGGGNGLPAICFVLAAKELGLYANMAAVAALAVRRLHSQGESSWVTGEPTARAIDQGKRALTDIVSEIIVQSRQRLPGRPADNEIYFTSANSGTLRKKCSILSWACVHAADHLAGSKCRLRTRSLLWRCR